jgi:hypothetical protein
MGLLDNIRVRNDNARISRSFVEDDARRDAAVAAETLNSSSLEWRDEKELQEHPDVVNEKAETGLKKAEASAVAWDKKAVYAIYAW